MSATTARSAKPESGRTLINGVNYYYEIHGAGEPLLLLHGGLGSGGMFAPILPQIAANRQVILVDLQGHGRTPLGARKFTLPLMGDDMAELLDKLGHKQVDVLGYSLGGGVGMRLAMQHPSKVRRLAMISAGYSTDGFYPEIRAQQVMMGAEFAPMLKDTPMFTSYAEIAPDVNEFPRLLQTIGDYMREEFDYKAELSKLTMPTLIAFGDADMYRPDHIVSMFQALGGGLKDGGWQRESMSKHRLAIVPGATHYDVLFSPSLVGMVMPFLDGAIDK